MDSWKIQKAKRPDRQLRILDEFWILFVLAALDVTSVSDTANKRKRKLGIINVEYCRAGLVMKEDKSDLAGDLR